MTTTNRKSSRVILQNNTRPLGIIKQHPENIQQSNDKFSIEGYAKKIVKTNSPNNVLENTSIKKLSSASNRSLISSESIVNIDHTECSKSINELKQEIKNLKKENSQLDNDLRKSVIELNNSKNLIDNLTKENTLLESLSEELKSENERLKNDYQNLSDGFIIEREQWLTEKQELEKCLNEIRRELENKIIEIRQKHREEVLSFEEKIRLLKNHLSDTLKMRSVERQFEIDRITNDLEKSQTNEENLRKRLSKMVDMNYNNSTNENQLCKNCMKELKTSKTNNSIIDTKKEIRSQLFDRNNQVKLDDRPKIGIVKSAENKH